MLSNTNYCELIVKKKNLQMYITSTNVAYQYTTLEESELTGCWSETRTFLTTERTGRSGCIGLKIHVTCCMMRCSFLYFRLVKCC